MLLKPERMADIGAVATSPSGKKVFIYGALPGEVVETEVVEEHSRYSRAVATKIIESSPHRVLPKDDEYLATSPWQILEFDYEQELKSQLLKEAFFGAGLKIGRTTIKTAGPEYFYRNKYNYLFTSDYNFAVVARRTNQHVQASSFSLPQASINTTAMHILEVLRSSSILPQDLHALLVRTNVAGDTVSRLYIKSEKIVPEQFEQLNNFEVYFYDQFAKQQLPMKQNSHSRLLLNGTLELSDKLLGQEFHYSIDSFFQINSPIYEVALSDIQAAALGDVVDMYSGVGTIGLTVADSNQQLTLVEVDGENTKYAMRNASSRSGTNTRVITQDASKALKYIPSSGTLILDPPRAGLSNTLTKRILEQLPQRILYLSCNPSTQARDVARLQEQYKMLEITGYNFFPKTPHIESLVVLDRK
jgi:23S rRNA (uracil1939-C5)-methyltransferase